jgi:hypothetical protein
MQKNSVKYVKFLFIGLFLSGLVFVLLKTTKPSRPICSPDAPNTPACTTGGNFELPIPLYPQQSDVWCWASSIQMCIKYIKNDSIPQCQIATDRFPRSTNSACDCISNSCNIYNDSTCPVFVTSLSNNLTIEHNTIKLILEKYNLTTSKIHIDSSSTLNNIKNNLCSGNPIIAILVGRGSHHIVVVKGYQDIDSLSTYLLINNPLNDKPPASCKGCFHVLPVNGCGREVLCLNSTSSGGTFKPLMYLAIIPKS